MAEVAAACGVLEETVVSYFPVKEAMVTDRLEATLAAPSAGLANPALTPVQTALGILGQELGTMTGWLAAPTGDPGLPSLASSPAQRIAACRQASCRRHC